jgi:serine/threonine-protein kinase
MPISEFGRFTILHEIASGGMSSIYLVREKDDPTGQLPPFVIKVLHRDLLNTRAEKAFLREVGILSAIKGIHRTIIDVLDHGAYDGLPYVAMSYFHGSTLGEVIGAAGAAPAEPALAIIRLLAEGLHAIHSLEKSSTGIGHIVHGDINPSNVLINAAGELRLIDFSHSRINWIEGDEILHTPEENGTPHGNGTGDENDADDEIRGTYGYMAPEQARGEGIVPASDIYNLGLLLMELLTGQPVFRKSRSPAVLIQMAGGVKQSMITRTLRTSAFRNHPFLHGFLTTALAQETKNRYRDAREVIQSMDMESFADRERHLRAWAKNNVPRAGHRPKG